ncbi:GNAT family N-acetyltransferase [Algoriphagus sp. CAU 1675]|uniref:GNAT family N-acetyltransferase n=1 Tax=Algoriphagus sp. CAU 1675 TaxID=3032597 RepID=UPI0023DA7AA8|nr:GNAT family N-acetyltransferase [Algoriphagus sp. CAU 1675]MDF2159163.1 GNAT family N-acetyltransferase [Algoriphagus sp. CAU 1675]
MASIIQASSISDLKGILDLQQKNLLQNISLEEQKDQGFVRVEHDLAILKKLNDLGGHIIAKDADQVVAYVLAMTKESKEDVPMLIPMFEQFDQVAYKGKKVSDFNYMTVGQVCVGKSHRGKGLFYSCYQAYRKAFEDQYEFAITEISLSNTRSLKAHEKVGFEIIHTFKDEYENWAIVAWDWR